MKNILCFIDVETTGLNSTMHEIIEIALIRESADGIHRFSTKIKPQHIEIASGRALEINGYNDAEWEDAPYAHEVAAEIASIIEDCTLVGHNVQFDADFLEEMLYRCEQPYKPKRRKVDTITLAHEHLHCWPTHSLSSLRMFFGYSTIGEHRARKDCEDMRDIYYLLLRASCWSRWYWQMRASYITYMWRKGKK